MKDISGAIPAHLMADPVTDVKPKNAMGKDDFMKLLMTQLRHQDPLKPLDHQDMATQLAQFGQLEQLSNIGAGVKDLRTGIGEGAKLQALGMIGKRVEGSGNEFELKAGSEATLRNMLKPDVKPVKASIYDAQGLLVREIDLANKSGDIAWNGKATDGSQCPAGKYTFRVHGVDKNGQAQDVGTELSGRVTAVEMEGATPMLVVDTPTGSTKMDLSKVRAVGVDEPAVVKAVPKLEPKEPMIVAEETPEEGEIPEWQELVNERIRAF